MGIKQYPYTKLLLKNNRCKGNAFVLINNGLLKKVLLFGRFMLVVVAKVFVIRL